MQTNAEHIDCALYSDTPMQAERLAVLLRALDTEVRLIAGNDFAEHGEEQKLDAGLFVYLGTSHQFNDVIKRINAVAVVYAFTDSASLANDTDCPKLPLDLSQSDAWLATSLHFAIALVELESAACHREKMLQLQYVQQAKQSQLRGEVLGSICPALGESISQLDNTLDAAFHQVRESIGNLHELSRQLQWLESQAEALKKPVGSEHSGVGAGI